MEIINQPNPITKPERNFGSVLSHSFEIYKGIFLYALLAMVLYIIASFAIQFLFGIDSQSLVEEMGENPESMTIERLLEIEGVGMYYGFSGLMGILIAPLFASLIFMADKYQRGLPLSTNDLFYAYRNNALNILIYSLLSGIIISIAFALCFFPGILIAPLFMLGYPLLVLKNANAVEAIKHSFTIAKDNYGSFIAITVVAFLISMAGLLFCLIGIIASFPFIYAAMYSSYLAFTKDSRTV